MEPFSVTCETCHARLKVRDPRIIGEVHACPKCDSMVHILPPAGHAVATAPTVASESTSASMEFPAGGSQFEEAVAAAATAATAVSSAPGPAVASVPAITETSPWVMWSIGTAALLVIGSVVGAWWGIGGDKEDKPAATAAVVVADANQLTPQRPAKELQAVPPSEITPEADAPQQAVAEATPLLEQSPPSVPEAAATESTAPTVTHLKSEANANPREVESAPVAPVAAASSELPSAAPSEPAPVLKFDPLDFDPARVALNNTPTAPTDQSMNSLAASTAEEAIAPAQGEVSPPDVEPAAKPTLAARLGPAVGANVQVKDASARLAIPVAALDVRGMPLNEFIQTVSDTAGLPITVSPIDLALAGVTAREPISVKVENSMLDVAMREALSKRRLAVEERDGQLVVVLADGNRPRAIDYDLSDLANDGDLSAIAEMIPRFVAPESWQAAGGRGMASMQGTKLHVEQSQRVQHEILIFCERLRLARGLPLRTRYPRELLTSNSSEQELGPLQERATFTFLTWTPLEEVANYWEQKSGLTVLVEWSALAKAGLSPSSPVACSAIERTWKDIFDGVLEPLGLAWVPLDAKTIQITTRDGMRQQRRVEFYSVSPKWRGQFASVATLMRTVENELQQYGSDAPGKPRLSVAFDEPSGQLIVLGSPTAHRHLASWLHNQATL